ncbi:MAG: Flap-structured DNA-binding and RNA-binding protein [Phylliscum demangeonii]|nr:MAG: Flap-structured DNA-binding and RNA-binding protein [Phylliscum demangeonii]
MSVNHLLANRNSTPEATFTSSSLRPPASRAITASHHLRASADMAPLASSPLSHRIRPSSEVYYGQSQQQPNTSNPDDAAEKAAQQWIADIDQYETTLEEMAAATLDQDFKDELSAIEQWFRVLSEAERTAALYALLQQTTQVQIRFFIQVLKQMAKSHPMSGVLSPANFEIDPMSSRLSDAMSRLSAEGGRASLGRPAPVSPAGNKRNSGLDPSTIHAMFPDAAAAIATQKAKFTQENGKAPESNRNSLAAATIEKRSSYIAPTAGGSSAKENLSPQQPAPSSGPWTSRSVTEQQSQSSPSSHHTIARPKSSASQQGPPSQTPMGQFAQPAPTSAPLRSPRPQPMSGMSGMSGLPTPTLTATMTHPETQTTTDLPLLSPYNLGGGNWASMMNTPVHPTFPQGAAAANQVDMVANATAMKLAAVTTVNNRIALDDARKYRRGRSTEGYGHAPGMAHGPLSPMMPGTANVVMVNEHGQVLNAQQVATLQAHQAAAAMAGRRSRPNSPGIAIHSAGGTGAGVGFGHLGFASPQNNGFLAAYDGATTASMVNNSLAANFGLGQFGLLGGGALTAAGLGGPGSIHEGYLSDHSDVARGRSPRGQRGTSRPPEDPTDLSLLQDIPNWLRSLRLHKYTDHLKDLKWTDLVELDDEALEKRGVNALGARRKMLKVFEQVKEAKTEGKL